MPEDLTPIRKQYLAIKREYPGAILFFRLGDFYETFDEDAQLTARELDIVLTSRPVGNGLRAPLAGIPYHAVDTYLTRLIQKGYHVAICEQIGEEPVNGIFPRKVVRVVTPGTVIEPGLLPGDSNNYLASFVRAERSETRIDGGQAWAGVAYSDLTTGEFAATELPADALQAELARLRPAETIYPDGQPIEQGQSGHLTPWPSWRFEAGKCEEVLLSHFNASTLDGFGMKGRSLATRAAGAVLQYVQATQPDALNLLTGLHVYSLSDFMTLDASTRRNLELEETLRGNRAGSLLGLLDRTSSPMGKRLIQQWVKQPLLDREKIMARQSCVQFFLDRSLLRAEVRERLNPLADLERLVNRVVSGHAQPRDLASLRTTLANLPGLLTPFAASRQSERAAAVGAQGTEVAEQSPSQEPTLPLEDLGPFTREQELLNSALADEPPATVQGAGIIRAGHSDELDSVTSASQHARDWLANLESVERTRTGIKTLKVGYNKVFGYYIEISKGAAARAPDHYIRKQTLVNGERYMTPEMKEYETLVLNAAERIHEIELRLFSELCANLRSSGPKLLRAARALAELDVYSTFAEVAAFAGYCRPTITSGSDLDIRDGRHPVVEQFGIGERFVPNDATFESGEVVRMITGPNMAGKSTYLRQVALIVLMAQMGSFVPARSARIGLVDRIFTRIGAQDEIHAGQSTFMVEMVEAANILHHATSRSLLILDEIGRGTSTYDGVSIAWAVVEFIHNHPQLRAKTLFATHYLELTQLASLLPGVRNYNVAVTEADKKVVFLHKIVQGAADKSYGIHVAQLAGLPAPVIQRANQILEELEKSSGQGMRHSPHAAQQAALFPETSPLLDELGSIDENSISPIEALNKLFEWKRKYLK
jgi:DNA mismatch repair protein MutS